MCKVVRRNLRLEDELAKTKSAAQPYAAVGAALAFIAAVAAFLIKRNGS